MGSVRKYFIYYKIYIYIYIYILISLYLISSCSGLHADVNIIMNNSDKTEPSQCYCHKNM
jgi:hypothetical protein